MESEHLILRAPEPADVELLYRWENDRESWTYSNTNQPFSRFDLEQYVLNAEKDIASQKQARFMIDQKKDGVRLTIGNIDLFEYDPVHARAGVGVFITAESRKQKLASEALEMIISYAFDVLNLHQLFCNIAADNRISIKLFENFNFVLAGKKRDWIRKNNNWQDELMYQLINK
ncbi:MAG: GNAT family N-acetyltransferase [Bacteroidales bacterium]|nr:GNAT family N-acetyltransferase [Bacteroidales bacterium]MCF8343100.1 GNAT family N-acetyltransferase [Bacteroidales bacterium]MCF8352092.1 GNAT family N-acetyltransferase [Bacteroidales bacterium]MCF8375362.1 GNAT family N-acetyltransferase [Bacteroidales bacterium]MCF8400218.1 GNAT family N-acetyltransferase [Bacteroidales bacterium]